MKTKIELTKEQIDKLVAAEEKRLQAKYESDLLRIRKKYEVVEIDIKSPIKQTRKSKLTDELLSQYLEQGLDPKAISEMSNYNIGYIYKIRKRVLAKRVNKDV